MIDYLFNTDSFDSTTLKRVGVEILDKNARRCACVECGEEWIIAKTDDGKGLPSDSWICPNGCNRLSLQIRSAARWPQPILASRTQARPLRSS